MSTPEVPDSASKFPPYPSATSEQPASKQTASEQRAPQPSPMASAVKRPRRSISIPSLIAQVFLGVWALVVLIPMVWALYTSLKSDAEIMGSPWSLPATPRFDNYARAWNTAQFGDFFINTILVTSAGMVGILLFASMASFTMAKFRFPGKGLIFGLLVGSMSFPVILALIPLFFLMLQMGLMDSRIGLTLVYIGFGMPFSIFFLTAFFRSIPDEMLEAARVDGCSWWGCFFRIMLPLAKPGLVSVGIFNFMSMWNQYILPLVLITDKSKYVLGLGVAKLSVDQGYKADWGGLFAGMVIAMVPVIVVYAIFQRQVQSGLMAGAVKA